LPQLPWKLKRGDLKKNLISAMIIFVFLIFFSILAVSMVTAAIWKKSTLDSTTSHGI
jgi:hypothetical protein